MTYSPGTLCSACNRGTLYETRRQMDRTVSQGSRQFQIHAYVPAYGCGSCDAVFYDNRADDEVQLLLAQQLAAEELKLERPYDDIPPVLAINLLNRFEQFTLPTQVVIADANPIPPERFTIGRAYTTDLQIAEDGIIGHRCVVDSVRGMESHQQKPLLLVEVWRDYGDDGHTNYTHRGWMVARESDFHAILKKYKLDHDRYSHDGRDFLSFLGGKDEPG